MRQFDAFNSYVGEGGKPLVGRILFYDTNSQPRSVYDANGVDLGYKISVELCGRTSKQVFLDDVDYIVTFQQKNGDGSYYSIGSVLNKMPVNIIGDQPSGPVPSVATKAALATLDPAGITSIGGKKIVQMLGYNVAGDKPSVYYWWNAGSVASDNGGSVIGSGVSVTGRWEIIASFEDVDSRHFGVFPKTDSIDTYVDGYLDHRNRISQLASYAYSMSKKVYFPNVGNQNAWYAWYDIGGSTIYGVVTDGNVVLAVSHGFFATVNDADQNTKFKSILNTSYAGGTIIVKGKTLKTSQDITDNTATYDSDTQAWTDSKTRSKVTLNPSDTLIYDSNYTASGKQYVGVKVNIPGNVMISIPTAINFYACSFNGVGKFYLNDITSYNFQNCTIDQNHFDLVSAQGFGAATFGNCRAISSDWPNNSYWIKAQQVINNSNVIDMTGRAITTNEAFKANIKIKGGTWSGNLAICPTGSKMSIEDADITGALKIQPTSNPISLKRCKVASISGGCSKLTAYDCEFTSSDNFNATVLDFDWCVLNCNFTGLSGSSVSNSEINQNLIIQSSGNAGEEQIYNIVIASNIFGGMAGLSVVGSSDSSSRTFVNNVWVHDNQVNYSGALCVTGYFAEVLGTYRFENNYGYLVQWRETKLKPTSYVNKDMGRIGSWVEIEIGNPGATEHSKVKVARPCLGDLVFNFGERYNLCNYGFHFLNTRCQMKWTTGYSGSSLETIQLGSSDDFDTGRLWFDDEKAVEQTFSILGTTAGHTAQNDLTIGVMPEVRTNSKRYQPFGNTNNVRMNIKIIPCEG